jgi:hypothetical protein
MAYTQIDLQIPCKKCKQVGYFMGFRSVRLPGTQVFQFMCKTCAAEVFQMYIKELGKLKARLDKEDIEKAERVASGEVPVIVEEEVFESYTDADGATWL